jgi:AcrR family transcriptional regulator
LRDLRLPVHCYVTLSFYEKYRCYVTLSSVSPRPLDPEVRTALIDAAAGLIAESGPSALSTRRLATETGTSTTAVYTYFGGKNELVREIVRDGFARLHHEFGLVEPTGDAVADLALLGRAYRHNARSSPNMYGIMFGDAALEGFALTENDRQHGRYTLTKVVDYAQRCIESGRFRDNDPVLVAHQMWFAVHGLVTLELGSYLIPPYDADRCFESQLVGLMTGAGDSLGRATESVADSAKRFRALFGNEPGSMLAAENVPDLPAAGNRVMRAVPGPG